MHPSRLAPWLVLAGLLAACGRTGSPGVAPLPNTTPPPGYSHVPLRVSTIEAPPTGQAGQPVTITALVVLPDGCVQHDATATLVDDASTRVVVTSRGVEQLEGICTQILTFKPVEVTFTPARSGTYTIIAPEGDVSTAIEIR
ncbi:MAG: hypothetical protein ACK46X_14145 [Candidatus Sericytochromatia bacterium]